MNPRQLQFFDVLSHVRVNLTRQIDKAPFRVGINAGGKLIQRNIERVSQRLPAVTDADAASFMHFFRVGPDRFYWHTYFFKTKVLNIITINNIKLEKINYEPTSTKIELYTYLNGDKHVIYESNSLNNIYIEESKSYSDLLTKDVIENIKNNLYIKVYTTDIDNNNYSYESKLILKQKLNNNKLCYNEYIKEQNKKIEDLGLQNPFLVLKENGYNMDSTKPVVESDNSINKLESLGFTYDGKTKTYTKVDEDGGVIEYKQSSKVIKKEKLDNGLKYTTRYVVDRNTVTFLVSEDKDKIIYKVQYFLQSRTYSCLKGTCKNNKKEIDYIISVYNEIMDIL